jgi:hypothetical protein
MRVSAGYDIMHNKLNGVSDNGKILCWVSDVTEGDVGGVSDPLEKMKLGIRPS